MSMSFCFVLLHLLPMYWAGLHKEQGKELLHLGETASNLMRAQRLRNGATVNYSVAVISGF
jgi:hypothetical protein